MSFDSGPLLRNKSPENRTHKTIDFSVTILTIAAEVLLRLCFQEYQFKFIQIHTHEFEGTSVFKL